MKVRGYEIGNNIIVFASAFFFAAWLFIYIGLEVTEHGAGDPAWMAFDRSILGSFANARSNALTEVMLTFTYMASTLSLSFVALIALLFTHYKKQFSSRRILVVACVGSVLFIRVTKSLFGRIRPNPETWLAPASGLSFPSGHSVGAFAVIGALFLILGRSCEQNYQRWSLWMLGALLVGMVGLSRVYLGVHYPSDVFGGFLLGFSIVLGAVAFDRHRREKCL